MSPCHSLAGWPETSSLPSLNFISLFVKYRQQYLPCGVVGRIQGGDICEQSTRFSTCHRENAQPWGTAGLNDITLMLTSFIWLGIKRIYLGACLCISFSMVIALRASSRTISRSFCRSDGNTRSHRLQGVCDTGLSRSGPSPRPDITFALEHWPLIPQRVKNPPAMQETLVWSLGQEDPLEKG